MAAGFPQLTVPFEEVSEFLTFIWNLDEYELNWVPG